VLLLYSVKFDVCPQIYSNEIRLFIHLCMFSSLFLIATVYQQLKRMNYMDVAGKESIHVTINDAVMHALKTVRSSNCIRFFLFDSAFFVSAY